MGCDIHMFIETKEPGGEWVPDPHHIWEYEDYGPGEEYKSLREVSAVGRWYGVFAKLAGVRGVGPLDKGLPVDVSKDLLEAHGPINHTDNHSASWYPLEDFRKIIESISPDNKWKFGIEGSTDAFYDYADFKDWKKRPQDWSTLINYCQNLVDDYEVESILLGQNREPLEVRLVFWFDN